MIGEARSAVVPDPTKTGQNPPRPGSQTTTSNDTMPQRYRVQFPPEQEHSLGQDEAYFYLVEDGKRRKFRFHDYDEIYRRPGLYEHVIYERLKCNSP